MIATISIMGGNMPNTFEDSLQAAMMVSPEIAGKVLVMLASTCAIYDGGILEAVYWQDYIKGNIN